MVRLNWGSRARRPAGKRLVLLLAMLCLFAIAVRATSASSPKPRGQQQASDTDLICPTDNASDCYPRVFQATNEFQPVREDQDLPPGLHVRLNIWTGEKEAKLHNESDENSATLAALEGLPVDQGVVLVDRPVAPEQDSKPDAGARPKGAPAYDPVGLVKEPGRGGGSSSGSSGEGQAFYDAVAVIKAVDVAVAAGQAGQAGSEDASVVLDAAEQARFAKALEQLDEFAHDIYYGVKLMEDEAATQSLLCLMSGTDAVTTAQQAAAVVAAALQNNPTALRAVERTWDQHKAAVCPMRGATLGETVFGSYGLMPPDDNDDDDNNTQTRQPHAAWVRSRLLAVNGLLKSETILRDFLASEGLTQVLQVLVEQTGSEYEAARARAAHLVLDNFLDASMGADVSLWDDASGPTLEGETEEPADNRRSLDCKAGPVHAGCWSYHARRWAEAHENDETHWSGELWRRLQDRIRGGPPRQAVGHDEL